MCARAALRGAGGVNNVQNIPLTPPYPPQGGNPSKGDFAIPKEFLFRCTILAKNPILLILEACQPLCESVRGLFQER